MAVLSESTPDQDGTPILVHTHVAMIFLRFFSFALLLLLILSSLSLNVSRFPKHKLQFFVFLYVASLIHL